MRTGAFDQIARFKFEIDMEYHLVELLD